MRRTSIFLVGVLVLSSLGFALQTKASSVGPEEAIVRLEVRDRQAKLKKWDTGVVVDIRGHILSGNQVLKSYVPAKGDTLSVCVSGLNGGAPYCAMRAVEVGSVASTTRLALFRVSEVKHKDLGWISFDESRLRSGNPFERRFVDLPNWKEEGVPLGADVQFYAYSGVGKDGVGVKKGTIVSYRKAQKKDQQVPWLLKSDAEFDKTQSGALVVMGSEAIGFRRPTALESIEGGDIVSMPVIRSFLVAQLGQEVISNPGSYPARYAVPEQGGLVDRTKSCPAFSSVERGTTQCRCHTGFFAVGNACVLGKTYCSILGGTYDYGLRRCEGGKPYQLPNPKKDVLSRETKSFVGAPKSQEDRARCEWIVDVREMRLFQANETGIALIPSESMLCVKR